MNLVLMLRSEAVSLLTLLLLLWYSSVQGIYESKSRYRLLNLLAIGHVVFDIITVICVNNLDRVPPFVNRLCHELLYATAILFCYVLLLFVTDRIYRKEKRRSVAIGLGLIPAGYLIAMSFLPIEYVEGRGTNYSYGVCVITGYACACVLFVVSLVLIIRHEKRLSSHDKAIIIPALIIMMIAICLQAAVPELLFTGADVTLVTFAVFIGIIDPVGTFRHMAYFDYMTGLRNHNCYDSDVKNYRKERAKGNAPDDYIFVICDINGLKQINDDYGHATGDDYIRHAARAIKDSLTSSYATYRIGGDEFCAIYFNSQIEQVKAEIAKLRKAFGSRKTAAGIQDVVDTPFSLSVGYVASLPGEDVLDAFKRADALMMEEKRRYYQAGGIDRRRTIT